jgi:redox-sensitive bicupin YhaK (pirin superfamily)
MVGASGPPRESRVVSSRVDLEDVSGRVLFPTPLQGPWTPLLRLAETVSTEKQDDSGGHSHKGEAVMNYVVEGRVEYEDDVGRRSVLDPGTVVLLTAREEAHHNLTARPAPRSRWLSVVVQCPPDTEGAPHLVQVASAPSPARARGGAIERRLVGREGPIPSDSGLECLEIEFRDAGECACPIGPERRAVAYLFEGSGSIDGQRVNAGVGVLTESLTELAFRAETGSRILLVSAPHQAAR